MSKKTTLQQLRDKFSGTLSEIHSIDAPDTKEFIMNTIAEIDKFLPVEREQIEIAYVNGCIDQTRKKHLSSEDYFTNTYETK